MQATYVEVSAGVRYWEDATINGTTDTDGLLTIHGIMRLCKEITSGCGNGMMRPLTQSRRPKRG